MEYTFTQRINFTPFWVSFNNILSKILLFLQSDPLFTSYGAIIFYSVLQLTSPKFVAFSAFKTPFQF